MRYLCQVWFEAKKLDDMEPSEKARIDRDSFNYDKEMERRGRMVLAEALQPVEAARTVRVRNGEVSTTDGPFAETKEQLGGFILIEAKDMEAAIKIAAGIPLARLGAIEVRPILKVGG